MSSELRVVNSKRNGQHASSLNGGDPRTRLAPEEAPAAALSKLKTQNSLKPRKLSSWQKREFEQLEGKIAQLEAEKAEAEKALYHAPPGKVTQVQQLYEQLEALTQAIDTATERWLELAELES